jgi:hypothetical protein
MLCKSMVAEMMRRWHAMSSNRSIRMYIEARSAPGTRMV